MENNPGFCVIDTFSKNYEKKNSSFVSSPFEI